MRLAGTLLGLVLARDVRGAELSVSTQTELFNSISNYAGSSYVTTGNSIMALGDTVTALSNTYLVSDTSGIAASTNEMFYLKNLYGLLQCVEALQCVLNGGLNRRVMSVEGTGGGVWTMKGLRFADGESDYVGGFAMTDNAEVEMIMCEFKNFWANEVSAFRPAAF